MTEITRLFDFPYYQLEHYNIPDALVTKYNGVWVKTSTEEYIAKANAVSRALLRMGIQKNDKIALISTNNRTEWNIMDIGILQTGRILSPYIRLFPKRITNTSSTIPASIYCFVSDIEVLQKINLIKSNLPQPEGGVFIR